jgi:folate-binding protein YgfZ
MGEDDWERARVTAGRPAPGAELTQDYNPLEAGLYHAVSITKGCYMGQETLAKVGRAGPPKQQLWGLQLTAPVAPGTPVQYEGDVIGSVTSYVDLQQYGDFALAYLKRKRKGTALKLEGAAVTVDGQPATVVAAPYSTWEFLDGDGTSEAEAPAAAAAAAGAPGSQQQQSQQSAEKAAEAAAKAERLRVSGVVVRQSNMSDTQAVSQRSPCCTAGCHTRQCEHDTGIA